MTRSSKVLLIKYINHNVFSLVTNGTHLVLYELHKFRYTWFHIKPLYRPISNKELSWVYMKPSWFFIEPVGTFSSSSEGCCLTTEFRRHLPQEACYTYWEKYIHVLDGAQGPYWSSKRGVKATRDPGHSRTHVYITVS